MATMYIERSGGCRRRASGGGDVIEPWFMLSRSAYQRILDVALADMTSAEVLQRACSSSSRSSELLRLLSAGDDVTTQLSLQPRNDNPRDSPVGDLTSHKSGTRSPEVDDDQHGDMDTLPPKCLPPPLAAKYQSLSAGDCRRRLEWSGRNDGAKRSAGRQTWQCRPNVPLCLRVPSYSRSRHAATAQSARRRRPGADTYRHVTPQNVDVIDDTSQSRSSSLKSHVDHDSDGVNDDARPPPLTVSEPLEHSHGLRHVEMSECGESKHTTSEQKSSNDLTRKRKWLRQQKAEVVRVDANGGDGWAPIDKDILVSIVERLSVSCLQPSSSSSSLTTTTTTTSASSGSSVQAKGTETTSTSTSPTKFRQPLTLTATPCRRGDVSCRSGGSGRDVAVTRNAATVTRDAATLPPSLLTLSLSSTRSRHVDLPPPHKTQRLRTSSPAMSMRSAGRRKSSYQQRVQVRDTWNVPADKSLCRASPPTDVAVQRHVTESLSGPRHVWAPLEKSVVLSVVDQMLVDSDVDDTTTTTTDNNSDTHRRCEQSSRRRWLEPPPLRAIRPTSPRTCRDTGATSSDDPVTTAAEASFKWKSNILQRMRKEQTVMATSSGRWLDLASEAVTATGS